MEHGSNSIRNLFEFAYPVSKIEDITGIDFFPGIADEDFIEAELNIELWQ